MSSPPCRGDEDVEDPDDQKPGFAAQQAACPGARHAGHGGGPGAGQSARSFRPHRSTALASQYSHSEDRAPEPYLWAGRRQVEHGPITRQRSTLPHFV